MIGKYQIQLGWAEVVSGMAQGNETAEAPLSPNSNHINPLASRGFIYSSPNGTSMSTNVTGNIIASDADSQAFLGYDRIYVDDEGGYYTQSGVNITKKQTGAATTKYAFPRTDIASFNFNSYVSLKDDIALFNTSGATSLDEDWWTNTKGESALDNTALHPLLVYERLLWIADGNVMHYVNEAGTVTNDALTFSDNERIMALGIDPATGLMMISTTTALDQSDARASIFSVYLFDGYSAKPRRKIIVEDLLSAFYALGGVVYVACGRYIGQWNGSGVTFLRQLKNAALDPVYKQQFSNIGNMLIVADGNELLAYGEVVAGKKAWFPLLKNRTADTSSTSNYQIATHYGSGSVAVAFESGDKIYAYSILGTAAGTGSLVYSKIDFPRPIYVRKIRVFTSAITTTSGIGTVGFYDEAGTARSPAVATMGKSGATTYVHDFDYGGFKTQVVQPFVTFASQSFGVERVIVYYDIAE